MSNQDRIYVRAGGQSSLPNVTNVGRCLFDPDWAKIEHCDQSSELIYIMRGSLRVCTSDTELSGSEGDVIWLPAGVPHRDVVPPDSDFEVYLIQFEWPENEHIRDIRGDRRVLRLSDRTKIDIANMVHALHEESVSTALFVRQIVACKLAEIIWTLCREAGSCVKKPPESDDASIRRARSDHLALQAKRLVKANYSDKLDLDGIARSLGTSPCYLSRLFTKYNGVTLSSYITLVRMENAKRLLTDSRMNIDEVARACGYRDTHYFRKIFKRHHGCPPGQWRARLFKEAKSV